MLTIKKNSLLKINRDKIKKSEKKQSEMINKNKSTP